MATVSDVAKYILGKAGPMTHMKLQKLCYYSQAWSLVWDEKPLFENRIEAWANGPVVRDLYKQLRGQYIVNEDNINGDTETLDSDEKETIDAIIRDYGGKSSQYLSNLTHLERPWIEARKGLSPGERGNEEITHASMAEYYEGLA